MLESLIPKEDLPGVLGGKKASPSLFYQSFRTAFKPLFEAQEPLSRLSGRKLSQHYGGALMSLSRQCSTELTRSLSDDWTDSVLTILHQAVQLLIKLAPHMGEEGLDVLRLYSQLLTRCTEKRLFERVIEYSSGLIHHMEGLNSLDKDMLYLKLNVILTRGNALLQSTYKTQEALEEVESLLTRQCEEALGLLGKYALNSTDHGSMIKTYTNMFRLLYHCGRDMDSLASGDLEVHIQALHTRQKSLHYFAKTKPDLRDYFSFAYSSVQPTYRIATSHQSLKLFTTLSSAISEIFNLIDHNGYPKYIDKNCCSLVEIQVLSLQKAHKYNEARQTLDLVITKEEVDSAALSYQNAKFLLDYARLTHLMKMSPVSTLLQAMNWLERSQTSRGSDDVEKYRKLACYEIENWLKIAYTIVSAANLESGEVPNYSLLSALGSVFRCTDYVNQLDLVLCYYVRTAVSVVLYLSSKDGTYMMETVEMLRKLFRTKCERYLSCVYNLTLVLIHKGETQLSEMFIEETVGYLSKTEEKCTAVHLCVLDLWSRHVHATVMELRTAQEALGVYVQKQLTLASLHELPSDHWDKLIDINHRLNRSLVENLDTDSEFPEPRDCLLYPRLHRFLHCYEERVRLAERELSNCKRSLIRSATSNNSHIPLIYRKQTEAVVTYLAEELRAGSRRQLARVLLEYIEVVAACPSVFSEETVLSELLAVKLTGTLVDGLSLAIDKIIDLDPLPDAMVWRAVLSLERIKQVESLHHNTVWFQPTIETHYLQTISSLQTALQDWAALFQCGPLDFSPGSYQLLKKKVRPALSQTEIAETIRSLLLCVDVCCLLEVHKMAAIALEIVKKLIKMQGSEEDAEVRKTLIKLRLSHSLSTLGFTSLSSDVSKLATVFDPQISEFPKEYTDFEYNHMWISLFQAERLYLSCDFLRCKQKCEAVYQCLMPGNNGKREEMLRGKCCWLKANLSLAQGEFGEALKWVNEGRRCMQETSGMSLCLQNLSLMSSIKDNCYLKLRDPATHRTSLFPWSNWAYQTLSIQLLDTLSEIYLTQGLVTSVVSLLTGGIKLCRLLGSFSLLLSFLTRKVTLERQMTTDPRLDCANICIKNDQPSLTRDFLLSISRSLFTFLLSQVKTQVKPTTLAATDLIQVSDESLTVLSPLDINLLGHYFSPYRIIHTLITIGDLTISSEFQDSMDQLHLSDQNFYKLAKAALSPHFQGIYYQSLRSLIYKRQASMFAVKKKTKDCLELLGRSILELGCCEEFLSALVNGKKCCSGFELNPHLVDELAAATVIYADLMVKSKLAEEGYGMLSLFGSVKGVRNISARRQIGYLLARNPASEPWTRSYFTMKSIGVTYTLQSHSQPQVTQSIDSFISFSKEIDPKWTVIGLSIGRGVLGEGLVITRIDATKDPVTCLLSSRCKTCNFTSNFGDLLEDFAKIMRDSAQSIALKVGATKWWQQRETLDSRLETWLANFQSQLLGPLVGLLLGKLVDEEMTRYIEGELRDLGEEKRCKECGQMWGAGVLHCLLNAVASNLVSNEEVKGVIEAVGYSKAVVMKKVRNVRKEAGNRVFAREPVVLVVDGSLLYLPWESIPALAGHTVTRLPAFEFLTERVTLPPWQPSSAYYILNPSKDLDSTQNTFQTYLAAKETWTGLVATAPTEQDFKVGLETKDLLLYCGHSSGEQYIRGDTVKDLHIKAVTLLIGCSSGMLRPIGQYEPQGIAVQYMLGGCPALVANLWDVTDKDIDRFAVELLRRLTEGEELASAVAQSRHVCKLKRLIGAAPVVYGVPLRLSPKHD